MTAAQEWAEALADWAIPEHILAAAPESPWHYPTALFARRADAAVATFTPSNRRALEALPEGGVVLDVGCGAGAASLPLADRAGKIIGIDPSQAMLDALRERGESKGVEISTIVGIWPDVAADTPMVDVAVCNHVAYNVADLAGFARTLTEHVRQRVVLEMT